MKGSLLKRCLVVFAVGGLAALAFASPAMAAMTVNTVNDEAPAGSSACSLREAIVSATSNTIGGDCNRASGDNEVTLPAGHYVLNPTLGQLFFAQGPTVTIIGANPNDPAQTWIDAAATPAVPFRVMEIASLGGATLRNLKVSGGLSPSGADGASAGQAGAPGAHGGGILNNNNGSLTLDHVVVTDNFTGGGGRGANSAGDGAPSGGGNVGGSGGGIYNGTNASLSITASTITGNGTGGGGAGGNAGAGVACPGHFPDGVRGGAAGYSGSGGGIFSQGSATITTTTVSENFTGVGGVGGNGGQGAGWASCDDVVFGGGDGGIGGRGGNGSWGFSTAQNKFQYLNIAGGGGIANAGTLNMSSSTISGNSTGAGGRGGASGNPGQDQDGDFNNAGPGGDAGSAGVGGGLLSYGNGSGTLTNVTVAGNVTGNGGKAGGAYSGETGLGGARGGYGGYGGGIWAVGANNNGPLQLRHVTISQNGVGSAGAAGDNDTFPRPGIRGQGAGVAVADRFNPAPGAYGVGFRNTLVANNGLPGTDLNCIQYYDPSQYVDLKDLSPGNNLSYQDNSCPGINGNPLLSALQNNGGATETMLPTAGSAALAVVPAASCIGPTDQRGLPRPHPNHPTVCDIGAVETGLASTRTPTTTTLISSANPSTAGQQVTYTATVSPAPTGGTVSFTEASTALPGCNAVPLSGGQASCSATYSAAGSHTITAAYSGDPSHDGSSSLGLSQVVQPVAGGEPPKTSPPPGPTGRRAAALKKCKKKKKGKARANCIRKAKRLPV
jgi:CSLREA domain-containing protein